MFAITKSSCGAVCHRVAHSLHEYGLSAWKTQSPHTRSECATFNKGIPMRLSLLLSITLLFTPILTPCGFAADETKKDPPADKDTGQRRKDDVGKNEELSFHQAKVVSQMTELEERMFRLSEALKSLEPENASRLLMGLKFAREELIQLQMKESQLALSKLRYNDALAEQKQLITKLQRLEQLLLSHDLDFQLQLERLRLMKELLRRIDSAIQEEDREKSATDRAKEIEEQLKQLRERLAMLKELIQRQTGHIAAAKTLSGVKEEAAPAADAPADALQATQKSIEEAPQSGEAVTEVTSGQQETRTMTQPLEEGSELIKSAGASMDQAVTQLTAGKVRGSLPPQQQALESLEKALAELQAEEKTLEAALTEEKFRELQAEQESNRKATDGISEAAVQLGDAGTAARSDLMQASGSMASAEASLGGRNSGEAGESQGEALESLKSARAKLAAEAQRLADRLRAEIKKRTVEGLIQMLEGQIAIRQSTERLQPRLADKARSVVNSVVALSQVEGKLIAIGDGLTALVEETEFGIALPAALRTVTDAMTEVKDRLAKAEASDEVIALEKQIEEDLESLIDAIKQLPSKSGNQGDGQNGGANDRERELNRMIAELKMVRLLQVKVNKETKDVDGQRPEDAKKLAALLLQRIETLQGRQEDIHDVTERIAEERADEIQQ